MASTDKDGQTPMEEESFTFGEYVSPNPKSIPIDAKLKPDPLIVVKPYKVDKKKCVKTESKFIEQQKEKQECQELIDNEENINKENINKEDINDDNNDKYAKKIEPTPLKIKVTKQQNEIESLKAQLFALKIENQRLKSKSNSNSNSNSVTPTNEENRKDLNEDERHIVFNTSVDILNGDNSSNKIELTDKVSIMRSARDSTPCKPKVIAIKPLSFIKNKNRNILNNKNNDNNNKENVISNNNNNKKTRNDYRITPIPFKRNIRKKFAFKSNLHSITDKENINRNMNNNNNNFNDMFDESEITPKDFNKIKNLKTPINNDQYENDQLTPNLSFNFGRERSETPSFLKLPGNKSMSSSFNMESTPEYSNNSGDGASNFVSPILTPIRGQNVNKKPFMFSWNKKK